MEEILVIGVLILIGYLIYKIYKLKEDYNSLQNNYQRTKTLCEAQQKEISKLKYLEEKETALSTATEQVEKLERYKATLIERMGMYIESKCESYPHLSGLMADMLTRHYDKSAAYLAHKEKPAIEEAKRIKELKLETKEIISEKKLSNISSHISVQYIPMLINYLTLILNYQVQISLSHSNLKGLLIKKNRCGFMMIK